MKDVTPSFSVEIKLRFQIRRRVIVPQCNLELGMQHAGKKVRGSPRERDCHALFAELPGLVFLPSG